MICTSAKYYYCNNQLNYDDIVVKCGIHVIDEMNKYRVFTFMVPCIIIHKIE
jgi:hypothetical protein